MKQKLKYFRNSFFALFRRLILEHRKFVIIFSILFLISFITGIFTSSEYAQDLTCENLINKYLYSFLCNDVNYLSFFLTMTIYFIIVSIVIIVFTHNKIFMILLTILFMLGSYIYSFDICVIFVSLGLSGIVIGFVSIGILGMLITFLIILNLAMSYTRATSKFKNNNLCNNTDYYKLYLLICFMVIILIFLLSFTFNIIHIFVIVE